MQDFPGLYGRGRGRGSGHRAGRRGQDGRKGSLSRAMRGARRRAAVWRIAAEDVVRSNLAGDLVPHVVDDGVARILAEGVSEELLWSKYRRGAATSISKHDHAAMKRPKLEKKSRLI
jgi:hypothetical protein